MTNSSPGTTERKPSLDLEPDGGRLSLSALWDPRFTLSAEITDASEHNFYAGFAENLSVSGVFVATHIEHSVGERVCFRLRIGEAEEPIRGVGEVRWVRQYSETSDAPPGVGLRFVELGDAARGQISEFLTGRDPIFFDEDQ